MVYRGKVKKIMDFGAFVEIMPGTEGLCHISQLDKERVQNVSDIVNEGDEMVVQVLEIDRSGKIRLSRKEAMGLEVGSVHEVKASVASRPPARFGQSSGRPRNRS
jgi:polyribonucleotide nucleotidyltransferase